MPDAETAGKAINKRGDTVNGGFMHGMPCGRAKSHDYKREDKTVYAVMTR